MSASTAEMGEIRFVPEYELTYVVVGTCQARAHGTSLCEVVESMRPDRTKLERLASKCLNPNARPTYLVEKA